MSCFKTHTSRTVLHLNINNFSLNLRQFLFIYLFFIIIVTQTNALEINNFRALQSKSNSRTYTDNSGIEDSLNSNWWKKKLDRQLTFEIKNEPIGTGVPIWKEVDLYGIDSRKGRSYSGALKHSNSSSIYYCNVSVLLLITVNILATIS